MAWSLLNHTIAPDVERLVAMQDESYGPEVPRALAREKALAVIHAALWAYSAREGSTAGGYAFMNLMDAIGVKAWSFDAEDQKLLSDAWQTRRGAEGAAP